MFRSSKLALCLTAASLLVVCSSCGYSGSETLPTQEEMFLAQPASAVSETGEGAWSKYLETYTKSSKFSGDDTKSLSKLRMKYAPASMFSHSQEDLKKANSDLTKEMNKITDSRNKKAEEKKKKDSNSNKDISQSNNSQTPSQQDYSTYSQSAQPEGYSSNQEYYQTSNNYSQSQNSIPQPQQNQSSTPSQGGYSTGASCNTVSECQGYIDSAAPDVMTQFHTAGGSTYYGLHNNKGGSAMLNQPSVTIDGETKNLGSWSQAQIGADGMPYGPDDGRQYVQTCGPDGKVYIAPVL